MLGTRVTVAALAAAALVLAGAGSASATQAAAETGAEAGAPAATAEPVLLVHGWNGRAADMETMRRALADAGHPAFAIDLPGSDNRANARAIADRVAQIRAANSERRVAIVAHSMGGLSARWYLQKLGGADDVDAYVSMGTAQDGYRPTCGLPVALAGQMCPDDPFMKELGQGDPSPGDARYTTLMSSKDDTRDQRLPGAVCHKEIAGVDHASEPRDPAFVDAVRTALTGVCP